MDINNEGKRRESTYRFSHARQTIDRFRVKLRRMKQQKRNEEKYFGYEVHCVDCVQVKNTPILIIVQKILSDVVVWCKYSLNKFTSSLSDVGILAARVSIDHKGIRHQLQNQCKW